MAANNAVLNNEISDDSISIHSSISEKSLRNNIKTEHEQQLEVHTDVPKLLQTIKELRNKLRYLQFVECVHFHKIESRSSTISLEPAETLAGSERLSDRPKKKKSRARLSLLNKLISM
uniref:Uncharacterized protein n=1 Tax=Bactrocera dorsalis TaxID=27457 RepID=A0A034WTY2_BACDO